jgi:hypothetical protein
VPSPSALRESGEASPTSGERLHPHLPSPTTPSARPIKSLARVHLGLVASTAQMDSRDGKSTLNITLTLALLFHFLVSFSPFCSLSPRLLSLDRVRFSFHLLLLRSYVLLLYFTPARAVLAFLSPLPSLFPSPPSNMSKTQRQGLPANSKG